MNLAILLRSLGTMVFLLGIAMGLCVGLGFIIPIDGGHNPDLDLGGWMTSLGTTLGLGIALRMVGRRLAHSQTDSSVMRRREAMGLVGVGWVTCCIVASLPYYFCAPHLTATAAIFESISGLTTTGATIFTDIESLPKTILLWRSVTQWVGGMGILAMFVVVLSGMGVSSKTLIGAESSLSNADLASLRQTMRHIWVLYVLLTLVGGLGLWLLGLTPFQAVNHILTTVSTGGFGTENDSIAGAAFTPLIKGWLILFMILGGVSFPFYLAIMKRNTRDLRVRYEEVWWFLGILVFASAALITLQMTNAFEASPIDIVFNVVSLSTSTGYVSADYEEWGHFAVGLIILLMMVGGCSGSTAGGLKVSRIVLWFRYSRVGLKQTFRPKAILPIKLNGRTVAEGGISQLLLVISLFGFFLISGSILLYWLEPERSLLGTLSLTVSMLANTGPAFGEMGPTENVAGICVTSKLLCSGLMVLGRLEYIAVLVLFSRGLWKRY